jgi:hypothetical protein
MGLFGSAKHHQAEIVWGHDTIKVDAAQTQLSHVATFPDLKLALHGNPLLAKAILCLAPILRSATSRMALTLPQQRTACALAVELTRENGMLNRDDDVLYLTDEVRSLLGGKSNDAMWENVRQLVDGEAKLMEQQIGQFVLERRTNDNCVWLVEMGRDLSPKPRNVLFAQDATSQERTRAFMAILYGLDSAEITYLLKHGSSEENPAITEKMRRARLQLAAGAFPEPAVYGESRT